MIKIASGLSVALALAACGGDDGHSATPEAPVNMTDVQGLYTGTTSNNEQIMSIVLDNGTFYVLYSTPGSSDIAGMIEGNGIGSNGSFVSSDARDINFEGENVASTTVSASVLGKQSLNGSIAYQSNTAGNVTFATRYSADYEKTPDLPAIAGTYSALSAVGSTADDAVVSIQGTTLAVTGPLACAASGTIAPHAHGNVFDVSMIYLNGACALAGQVVTGIAYYDVVTGLITVTALTGDRSQGALIVGTR